MRGFCVFMTRANFAKLANGQQMANNLKIQDKKIAPFPEAEL